MTNWVKQNLPLFSPGLSDPFMDANQIVPHDTNELENYTRGLWIGIGGRLTVVLAASSTAVTFENVPDGTLIPMLVRKVKVTGTSCELIVGLW